ncbi:MAG: signal recognition particle protein [Gemmatimonadota bacterium]|nr:MAG: signal recognition particle protein [Gemmatimonadota bacterium]
MFQELTGKLETVFKKLRGYGKLSEKNIQDSLREVRRALLEADVHYKVARQFIARVQEKAIGQDVFKSITPGQQVIRVVYDELTALLGGTARDVHFSPVPPTLIMLVGLQGSGKTTAAGKLARYFRQKGRKALLVAADIYRPAAIDQAEILARSAGVPCFHRREGTDPVDICVEAISFGQQEGCDVILFDTAGRLHIDDEMMNELVRIKKKIVPHEILLVADGMTGQDAVNMAGQFQAHLEFDGILLTKLDGDARGGAALSMLSVTGKPIKFVSVGEKLDALERFHPDRMASRILGMGDILSLVEKAEKAIDEERAKEFEEKLRKESFTFEDFLEQLDQIKGMGSLEHILGMIPGMGGNVFKNLSVDETAFTRIEAMIRSMTREERWRPEIIDGSRRRRIAAGSGTTVQEVNRLLKQFSMMKKMVKNLSKMNMKQFGKSLFSFR